MEGEYVILAMCSWFRIICWHCWRARGNKWITHVDLLRPLKNHGLTVFILNLYALVVMPWVCLLRILGLPMSDSVWNCGRSLVLWVPGISGSIGNGILGEYFPEREYNLLNPKRTRKRPKFQPCVSTYPWIRTSSAYPWISISTTYPWICTSTTRHAGLGEKAKKKLSPIL